MTSAFPVAILAGGLATRLRPLTKTIPKALLDIQGYPFIYHQLHLLKKQGIDNVVMCINYLGEQVEGYVGNGERFGLKVQYVYDGETQLGTAGALKKALPLLGENFFVLYGDSYLPCNFPAVQRAYQQSQKKALMTIYPNQNAWDASNVEYRAGSIITYDKKNRTSSMHYIDYGLGVFSHSAFSHVFDNQAFDLAILYQWLLKAQQLAAYVVPERFYEVGSLAGIEEFSNYILGEAIQ